MFSIFRVTPAQRDRAKNSRAGQRSSSRKTQIRPKTAAHPTATRLPVQQFPHMEKFLRVGRFPACQKFLRVLRFPACHSCDIFRRFFVSRSFHNFRRCFFVLNRVFMCKGISQRHMIFPQRVAAILSREFPTWAEHRSALCLFRANRRLN